VPLFPDGRKTLRASARSATGREVRGRYADRALDIASAIGVGILISVGFPASFDTLLTLAMRRGHFESWLAPAVPLALDVGIITLSLRVCRLAREGRRAVLLRLAVAGLSVGTVAANAAAGQDWLGRRLHGVPPAMFVVCFESVVISIRRHALECMDLLPAPLPRIRGIRWLLAPWTTWRMWRAAVLANTVDPSWTRFEMSSARRVNGLEVDAAAGSASPVVSTAAAKRAVEQVAARPSGRGARRDTGERLAAAIRLLRPEPGMTAPMLATRLRTDGHALSPRTARRLRARALQELRRR
jgi:hypothetical protein